jgi:RNA polymerase-binding transcription factor DksA
MEVMMMDPKLNTHAIENPVQVRAGLVWNRLHSEREDVCEALLKESPPNSQVKSQEPAGTDKTARSEVWHRELLQARLRKLDDALDRLMTGSYGSCCTCGRWIQDSKLDFDPAVAFCVDCWDRQTKH